MRECPRCHHDKADASFIGVICGDCHAKGKDLEPVVAPRQAAPRLSTQKEGPTMPPATASEPKAAATPRAQRLKACRYCSKEMPQGSLFRHEHVVCPKRPGAGEEVRPRAQRKKRSGPRRATGRPRKMRTPAPPVAKPESTANGCLFCAGPQTAVAKDLFARMLRGGMGFDVAAELVRDVVRGMEGRR